jgi:hypothetical protein
MADPAPPADPSSKKSGRSRGVARRWLRRIVWVVALFALLEVGIRIFVSVTDVEHTLYRHDDPTGWLTAPHLRIPIDVKNPPLHFTANTDSFGLRGDADTPPKAPGEYRILVLGDSFTWGIGVESAETFPAALERRLREGARRPITVVNGGMPSYGTVQELAFYRAYAARFEADMVVLAYYLNDDGDNATRFVFVDGYLWEDPTLIFGHPSYVVELIVRLNIRLAERRGWITPHAGVDGHARSLELIGALRAECEADHRPFFVLQIPARDSTKFVQPFERASPHQPLEIPPEILISMYDEVERQTESPYLLEHHLDPAGHELAADVLARELKARAGAALRGEGPQ